MFGNMMGKLQEMQQKAEETKQRLETVMVEGASPQRLVRIELTASRKVKSVAIAPELIQNADKEELEDHVFMALNEALTKAEQVFDSEMKSVATGLMPGLGI